MNKPDLHIVSLSGGKDSTAMLLRMLEEKMPVDIILFCRYELNPFSDGLLTGMDIYIFRAIFGQVQFCLYAMLL